VQYILFGFGVTNLFRCANVKVENRETRRDCECCNKLLFLKSVDCKKVIVSFCVEQILPIFFYSTSLKVDRDIYQFIT
jgi:hypothetical protein